MPNSQESRVLATHRMREEIHARRKGAEYTDGVTLRDEDDDFLAHPETKGPLEKRSRGEAWLNVSFLKIMALR